jgi:hypothetical protein
VRVKKEIPPVTEPLSASLLLIAVSVPLLASNSLSEFQQASGGYYSIELKKLM